MNLSLKFKLGIILLIAACLRLYGLKWDQGHHLHPDERFLTMVTQAIRWPKSFAEYLNPQISSLNPYNANYNFFVYGTLPMKIVKATATMIKLDPYPYNNITLVGRFISALFDLGTVFLIFKIAQKIFNEKVCLFASFLYATCVLPIQLSHFYAVDTFLVFFLTLSFYLLILLVNDQSLFITIFLGAVFGLALACKISAVLFLPIIGLGLLFGFWKKKGLFSFFFYCFLFAFSSYLFLRLADPRMFADHNLLNPVPNPQFLSNLKELQSSASQDTYFPPAVQWINRKPFFFPLKNMLLWGLGLPLGLAALGSIIYSILKIRQSKQLLILIWVLLLFSYQAGQFVKALRYFFPLYPLLITLTANFLTSQLNQRKILLLIAFLVVIWPLSFISIYSRPHSRVMASQWIYKNIPPGSTVSCEHWDDCLPLGLNGQSHSLYQTETLALFGPDTPEKWQTIDQQLKKIDYLIMSSNRLWGSIPRLPTRYPKTSKFYQDLFAGSLNFQKMAEITSYPTLPILNLSISDDSADESFTVYDHPKVIIFKKVDI